MTDWPPRVLSTVYRNGLQTFYDFLVDLITKALHLSDDCATDGDADRLPGPEFRQEAEKRLIREGDPPEYLSLLKSSYAAMPETAPAMGHISFEQRWTQQQIVERVIALKFRQEAKPSHVLCSGYRKLRPSVNDSRGRRAPQGLECACDNSSVDIVTSHSWKILLSRVGDLVMLYVLSHAAIFTPLPNNCFLQIVGAPTSSVSMSRKALSLHPGEKMLGGFAHRKWMSESYNTQQKKTESPADDGASEGHKFKEAFGKSECASDEVTGLVKNQSSDIIAFNKFGVEKGSISLESIETLNILRSSSLKRHRTENTESGLKTHALEGHKKCCDLEKSEVPCKRQRCGPREQSCQNGAILKQGDPSNGCTIFSLVNGWTDMPAKPSVARTQNQCSKRKDLEGTRLQVDNKVLYNDNDENPHTANCSKRLKPTEVSEKYRIFQVGNKLQNIADQVQSDLSMKFLQPSKCSNISKKNASCCLEHKSGTNKHEAVSRPLLNHNYRESPVVQDACPPGQLASASLLSKRIRPPSWKRRKLRQAQEPCQELGCKEIADQANTSQLHERPIELDEESTRAGNEKSDLFVSGLQQCQASDRADLGCSLPCGKHAEKTGFGRKAGQQVLERQKLQSGPGTTLGMCQRLVDRSPIFYNSNFSCHPGLPAKHILNTTNPNVTGVAHLFSTIFGDHCNISNGQSVHKLLKELLSNARQCSFARLLGRHCPLPQGFQSLPEDSSPAVYTPLLHLQNPKVEQQNSELDRDGCEDEQQGFPSTDLGPELVEIMRIYLGPNYQPRGTTARRELDSTSISLEEASSSCKVVNDRWKVSSSGQKTVAEGVQAKRKQMKRFKTFETCVGDNVRIEKTVQAELISCYTNHSKVVGFLWAVCRSIIPKDMLGCLWSWRALRSSISHFVGLRRHEKFNVQHALFRLQVSSFPWLAFSCSSENKTGSQMPSRKFTVEERELQQKRLELWLYWLFTSLVVPIIRSHFYVTENENYRQNVFYYRKSVWARIQFHGLQELTSKNYKKLSRQAVSQVLKSRVLGFSQIRLLPKRAGLRPIANLAASSQGTLKFSIQAKGKATLHQVFGGIPNELSSGDCSKSDSILFSFPLQTVCPILEDKGQDATIYETSSARDAKKDAIALECSLVDGCSNCSREGVKESSCSASNNERLDSLFIVKAPQIQKRSKKAVSFYFRSINSVLKDVHCCLKLEKEAHPHDLGSSVFGYSDIHTKVLPFILQLKGSLNGMPPLFMAVCDVTKAYDTIQQEKLHQIVERFMQSSNYRVARYTCMTPTLASVRVSHDRACTLADKPHKFVDFIHNMATKHSQSIFMDQALSYTVRRELILAMLREHVKQNIVQIGAHFYQQTVGIPQGSILSSFLCSLFYGHFDVHSLLPLVQSHPTATFNHVLDLNLLNESTGGTAESDSFLASSVSKASVLTECDMEEMLESCLDISDKDQILACKPTLTKYPTSQNVPSSCPEPNILDRQAHHMLSSTTHLCEAAGQNKDSVLVRLIDDSLFISTSKGKARIFIESMHKGSKEYGCQANERKTAASFHLQLGSEVLPRNVYKTEDGACFMRWSGLLINCYTMEFQADYTRYCGEHIRSTLTVRRDQNQGWQLVLKLCQYMRPKCHALFFDPRINSPATIRLNAFQAFLLSAMKFHAYVCCLRNVMQSNQPFLYKAIDCAMRYMYGLLRHKMDTIGAEAGAYFPYKELRWLALVAFYRVLKRKQTRYQVLLHMLQAQLHMPKYNIVRARPHLLSATDERRSSMFKFIKY